MWSAWEVEGLIRRMAKPYPAVLITSARQTGKTSLLRYLNVRLDQDRSPGRFLLTGSQIFPSMHGLPESGDQSSRHWPNPVYS